MRSKLPVILSLIIVIAACRSLSSGLLEDESSANFNPEKIYAALRAIEKLPPGKVNVNQLTGSKIAKTIEAGVDELEKMSDDDSGKYRKLFLKSLPSKHKPYGYTLPVWASANIQSLGTFDPSTRGEYLRLIFMASEGWVLKSAYDTQPFFDEALLTTLGKTLQSYNKKGVSYDGVAGYHRYKDKDLEIAVDYFATAIVDQPEAFDRQLSGALAALKPKLTQENSNNEGGDSRIELPDLITNRIKLKLLSLAAKQKEFNLQFLGKMAENIYNKAIFGKMPQVGESFAILRDSLLDPSPFVMCAGQGRAAIEIESKYVKDSIALTGTSTVQVLQLDKVISRYSSRRFKDGKFTLVCAGKRYALEVDSFIPPKIPQPQFTGNGDVHGIFSLALISEMDSTVLIGALAYLSMNGYLPLGIHATNSIKKDYLKIAGDGRKQRVLIPVGHSFKFNEMSLGNSSGLYIKARRKVGNRNIMLHMFTPPLEKKGRAESLDQNDMKKILCGQECPGIVEEPKGISIVTNSCYSVSTVDAWMLAFYKAIKENKTLKLPTPFVVGSASGFDTESPFIIISHMDHALRYLEGLASGQSPETMKKVLSSPLPMTGQRKALRTVQSLSEYKDKAVRYFAKALGAEVEEKDLEDEDSEEKPAFKSEFDPVCNIDNPRFFNGRFRVFNVKVKPIR